MEDVLIQGGLIVPSFEEFKVIRDGAILIQGDHIEWVGPRDSVPRKTADVVLDARGKAVIPGFINAHSHIYQAAMRTLGADRTLISWLNEVKYPITKVLTQDDLQLATQLGCAEMVRSGITTVIYMQDIRTSFDDIENDIYAMREVGIRTILARGIRERTARAEKWNLPEWITPYNINEEISITERLIRKWNTPDNLMVRVWPAPSTIWYSTREGLLKIKDLAERYKTGIHLHVAETRDSQVACIEDFGCREVELLAELGLLQHLTHAVHAVWLTRREIKLLSESGCSVIHNPVSNCYLASGIAEISTMSRFGVNIALGTDGAMSSDVYDMFEVIKSAALIQKASTLDPRALTAQDVLQMATINGAKAIGMERYLGTLEPGKKADIVLIDLKKPHLTPIFNLFNLIVYCVKSADVDTVLINGKLVLQKGHLKTVNEEEIMFELNQRMSRFQVSSER